MDPTPGLDDEGPVVSITPPPQDWDLNTIHVVSVRQESARLEEGGGLVPPSVAHDHQRYSWLGGTSQGVTTTTGEVPRVETPVGRGRTPSDCYGTSDPLGVSPRTHGTPDSGSPPARHPQHGWGPSSHVVSTVSPVASEAGSCWPYLLWVHEDVVSRDWRLPSTFPRAAEGTHLGRPYSKSVVGLTSGLRSSRERGRVDPGGHYIVVEVWAGYL